MSEHRKFYGAPLTPRELNLLKQDIDYSSGRPERDVTIMPDEILDLRILLETTNDVKEFVNML